MEYRGGMSGKELRAYCEVCDENLEIGTISPTQYLLAVDRLEQDGYPIPVSMAQRADRIGNHLLDRSLDNFFSIAEQQQNSDNRETAIQTLDSQRKQLRQIQNNLKRVA